MKTILVSALFISISAILPAPSVAQKVSFDASLGFSVGSTSADYSGTKSSIAGDMLIAVSLHPKHQSGVVTAAAAGFNFPGAVESRCVAAPSGGCLPHFPEFAFVSVLAGLETANANFRALVGPAAAHISESSRETGKLAFCARAEAAQRLFRPISMLGSMRSCLVPAYRGESVQVHSFAIGLRVR